MSKLRVAFQGELGAFSQQAIQQFYGRAAEPVPCQRFDQAFGALSAGDVQAAALPIENTLHGSVHENYDLLLKHDLGIVAETNVRIVHNLIVKPGASFAKIRRVASHPVALNQCLDFFAKYPRIEKIVYYDTAGSVKRLMEEGTADEGAIASELAAKVYGGAILKKSIEDDRRNFTRFFLLERRSKPVPRPRVAGKKQWKTSLVFTTRNVPGSLFRTLGVFALRDLSLAKIESRPLRGKPWEYLFYVDLLAADTDPRLEKALGHLAELSDFQRVLGSYFAV
ncbi:MAG: prephenate dehydratase [Bryobacteraceae bacterium]